MSTNQNAQVAATASQQTTAETHDATQSPSAPPQHVVPPPAASAPLLSAAPQDVIPPRAASGPPAATPPPAPTPPLATGMAAQAPIHATNAWNPTGRNLQPLPGTRLYYAHAEALNGPRTFVLLGSQQHLTFVADLDGHVDAASLRSLLIDTFGLYPHQIDLDPRPGLPRVADVTPRRSSH